MSATSTTNAQDVLRASRPVLVMLPAAALGCLVQRRISLDAAPTLSLVGMAPLALTIAAAPALLAGISRAQRACELGAATASMVIAALLIFIGLALMDMLALS